MPVNIVDSVKEIKEKGSVKKKKNANYLLISLVQAHPSLYNKADKEYLKDRKDVWAKIAAQSERAFEDGEKAKIRMKSLPDRYVKEKKAKPSGKSSSLSLKAKSLWPHFGSTSFMDPFMEDRKERESTLRNTDCVSKETNESEYHEFNEDEVITLSGFGKRKQSSSSDTPTAAKMPRKSGSFEEQLMNFMGDDKESAEVAFGRSIGKSLEVISNPIDKSMAKMEIQRVIANAEMGVYSQQKLSSQQL